MGKPRNLPIDIQQGATKKVTFIFKDKPDLEAADITLRIKEHLVDAACVLEKKPDNMFSNLPEGIVVFKFTAESTITLEARTHTYELEIVKGTDIYKPILGDFKVYSSITA